MLTDFETITQDLLPFEVDEVLPLLVRNFRRKIKRQETGKNHAVTSDVICEKITNRLLQDGHQYKLVQTKLRKMIGVIRQLGYVHALCSSSKGYYVAKDLSELDDCIKSLQERVRQQQRVVDALIQQRQVTYHNFRNENQTSR